jgi:AcrR family transcriptional regulator
MSKGEVTRSRILDVAMQIASRTGLDGLTIGSLAEALSLSKSGLFAHFGSKEALQVAVLEHTRERFGALVATRLHGQARGIATLRAFVQAWLDWIASPDLPAGCPILGATFEFEAREGPTRDLLVRMQKTTSERLTAMIQGAIDAGDLPRDLDIPQMIFELRGITLAFHQELHIARNPGARSHADHALAALFARSTPAPSKKSRSAATRD